MVAAGVVVAAAVLLYVILMCASTVLVKFMIPPWGTLGGDELSPSLDIGVKPAKTQNFSIDC